MTPRRVPDWMEDDQTTRCNVFVPGAMGAGILVSLAIVLLDAARKFGSGGPSRRRAGLTAEAIGQQTLEPVSSTRVAAHGRRARRTYLVVAAVFGGTGIYVLAGSFWNYFNPSPGQQWVENIAWLWAISTVAALALITVGATALSLAFRQRAQPMFAVAIWLRTPLAAPLRRSGGRRPRVGTER